MLGSRVGGSVKTTDRLRLVAGTADRLRLAGAVPGAGAVLLRSGVTGIATADRLRSGVGGTGIATAERLRSRGVNI